MRYAHIIGAAVLATACADGSAQSVSTLTIANLNSCVSAEEAFQRINNEGQLILITADRPAVQGDQKIKLRYIYTADRKFDKGYEISQTPSGCFEKSDTYNRIRLLNSEGVNIDPRTIIPMNSGKKNSLADAIYNGAKNIGEKPMLQYFTTFKNSASEAVVTITGKHGVTGSYILANASGIITNMDPYYNPKYMAAALATLGLTAP